MDTKNREELFTMAHSLETDEEFLLAVRVENGYKKMGLLGKIQEQIAKLDKTDDQEEPKEVKR